MKIKSMTATFGRLDKARLEPGPGLTLIHAPNEGGKSTWAAFWRAMLYGIDTRDRDKKGYLADKNRYQPWSGAPMEGELVLDYEGRDITIRRGPRGNTPFGTFSAVYTGTQEPVPGLTASNCGELLTGAGVEMFTRSAFLGNGNLSLTAAPELERRIAALVTSGEEDVSFSQAMERLKAWKNRRQVNRSVGEIPKLESELEHTQEALAQLEDVAAQAARLEGERASLIRTRDGLTRQAEAHRLLAQKKLADRYTQAGEEYHAAQKQLSALEAERSARPVPDKEALKQAQGELQYLKVLEEEIKQGSAALEESKASAAQAREAAEDERFTGLSSGSIRQKSAEDSQAYQDNQTWITGRSRMVGLIIVIAALAGGLTFLLTRNTDIAFPLWYWVFFLGVLLSGLPLLGQGKRKKENKLILERWKVSDPEEIIPIAEDFAARREAAEKAAHEAEVIQNAVAERQTKRDDTKSNLLDFVHQFAPEVKDMFGCSAALSRALNMDHDLALARERVSACRRRLDDLAAQGAEPQEGPVPELPVPDMGLQETERALLQAADRLEQVDAQLNQARGTLHAMGDPAVLSAQAEQLEERLSRRRLELDALTLAMDTLTQANARLQERFSPELNQLTGQYMARLTGDKYPAVSFTRELEGFIQVREGSGVLPRSALYLSRGTADQLYLALRLAVCRLCLRSRPPIVLDDALSSFDDERLTLALELLWELSGEQQMLLFTCQRREGEALGSTPGVKRLHL